MVEEFAESSYKDKQARSAENLFARQFRKRLTHVRKACRYDFPTDVFRASACQAAAKQEERNECGKSHQ